MGKKRKASGRPYGQSEAREARDADSNVKPIQSFEDVADSEDEFHINRDKILLEESADQKRQRRWREEDDLLEPSDEEVLAYPSPSEDEDEDEDLDSDDANNRPPPPKRARQSSNSDAESHEAEEEELEGWGTTKRDYYDADMIETEQDAIEEETEARRLQQKRLQGMTEADFGLDENDWLSSVKGKGQDDHEAEDEEGGVVTEILPQVEITEDMGMDERLRLLRSRYLEFEPLGAEFISLQSQHRDLGLSVAATEGMANHKKAAANGHKGGEILDTISPAATVKFQALTAYLGALSMYFALLTSTTNSDQKNPVAMPAGELREHAVMESLVKCRGLWEKVKGLRIPDSSELAKAKGNELAVIEESEERSPIENGDGAIGKPKAHMEKKQKKKKKSKAQRAAEAAQVEAEARRAERIRKTEEGLAELDVLTRTKPRKPNKQIDLGPAQSTFDDSDFGEETHLNADEAAEKARKKKSLRFYTSQITQKSNKRDQAGNDAGGDADLPYRERLRDRQARLNTEAEKRGQKGRKNDRGDDALGASSDDNDHHTAKDLRNADEEYYNLLTSTTAARKSAKKSLHDAHAASNGRTAHTEEPLDPTGKRAIGYTIEKNKGLAPKRGKDVRNPRVKKRKKYEEKVKKLGSVRQVFRGGEGKGGYKGELTGIKTGLVRSVKL
ncbi:hypothetical protein FGG08_006939 [Glutinoglossum americanum]|uniref:Sas10 C-terminal domain-containing protein n=1 Tax=Glutinoglossum americanum TaxID=1670608 RepID=A0A9P8I4B5_9PEZI|nr:hypothetical protein FGG08_006939 [Glutinoglossum americanum]